MVQWPKNVNKKILRDTSWSEINGVVESTTLSGKKKRRLSASMGNKPFAVKMKFTHEEYLAFKDWYENITLNGLMSFEFPSIDQSGANDEYMIKAGSAPSYSNPSGRVVMCSMEWEKV